MGAGLYRVFWGQSFSSVEIHRLVDFCKLEAYTVSSRTTRAAQKKKQLSQKKMRGIQSTAGRVMDLNCILILILLPELGTATQNL